MRMRNSHGVLFVLAAVAIAGAGRAQVDATFKSAYIKQLAGVEPKALEQVPAEKHPNFKQLAGLWRETSAQVRELAAKVSDATAATDAAVKKTASGHLATLLSGGEAAADAEQQLLADKAAAKAALDAMNQALHTQRQQMTLRVIGMGMQSGARYAGQYVILNELGDDMPQVLLQMVENPPPRVDDSARATILSAIRDLTDKADEKMLQKVQDFAKDAFEDDRVKEMAGYVLCHFGKKEIVEQRIAALNADTKKAGSELTAYQRLAELYWQIREHGQAIDAYQGALKHATDLPERELATLHYNLACSQSLAGKIDDAFASLDKALEIGKTGLSDALLSTDHDINNLRKDKRFDELLTKHGRSLKKKDAPKAKTEGDGAGAGKSDKSDKNDKGGDGK